MCGKVLGCLKLCHEAINFADSQSVSLQGIDFEIRC